MDRLVSNELERTSQGALSGPSISKLMLMPFTVLCIAGHLSGLIPIRP
jgi:hypothetical protein